MRRPARFTSPCSITILTPGWSRSVVRKTERHSWALSMAYFSEIARIAIGAGSSGPTSATSPPSPSPPAVAASTDRVIGIGQNRPSTVRISSQTPRPVRLAHEAGERSEPAMPSITTSPASREDIRTEGRRAARSHAAARASPSGHQGPQRGAAMRGDEIRHPKILLAVARPRRIVSPIRHCIDPFTGASVPSPIRPDPHSGNDREIPGKGQAVFS